MTRTLLNFIVAALVSIAASAQTQSSGAAGVWSGAIEVPASPLAIVVRLVTGGDGWRGTIDIPAQGAKSIGLVDVTVSPPAVSFRIPNAPGDPTIKLTLAEDGSRMTGTLTQGGATIPVSLTRGEPPARKRPQTPARPFPYDEEEVTVRNETAGITLAGTFTRPRGGGRYPAVLLLTGSGQQDRDETLFEHKPFLVLSDYLTRRGIAVLRLDDRGVGGSDRGPLGITSKDLAGDALAGVAFLRGRPDVDPARVGLVGHSEGAMLAAMAAAESPDIAFIVMVAGTGVPGDWILLAQAEAAAKTGGASDAVIAWDRSVRERVYKLLAAETDGKPDPAARQRLLDEVATLTAPGLPENASRDLASALLKAGSQPWLRYFLVYDPRQALAKVKVPVLAIGGERDLQVPAAENLKEIEGAIKANGNADVTTVLLPGLNHLMQTSATGAVAEYSTIEETFAPAALQLIGDWIVKRTSR